MTSFSGTWLGSMQPFGVRHDFTLEVTPTSEGVDAGLTLVRHGDGDPDEFRFNVHPCVNRQYLAVLSEDKSGLGVNAMVLKLTEDTNRLQGRIIWNSRTRDTVDESAIEFKRTS